MGASVRRAAVPAESIDGIDARMRDAGLSPRRWGNSPGDRYGWHEHQDHKVLYCVEGSIVFHTHDEGDLELHAGDRLDLTPGTDHAATVGGDGVECVEAYLGDGQTFDGQ